MSNKRYRRKFEPEWVVAVILPLSPAGSIRLARFETKKEARAALAKLLRGYLRDRRENPSEFPMMNRIHVTGQEDTHLYFTSRKLLLPLFVMTRSRNEYKGPISLVVDKLGGLDELRKIAAPLVGAWFRAMVALEKKRGQRGYKVTRRRKR